MISKSSQHHNIKLLKDSCNNLRERNVRMSSHYTLTLHNILKYSLNCYPHKINKLSLEMKIFFQYGITIVVYFGQVITQQIHIIRNIIEIVVDFSTQ